VIETSLYILRTRADPDERVTKHVNRIGEQLGIANGIITNLLDMIRDRPLSRETVRLDELVRGVLDSVKRPPEVAVEIELDGIPPVSGDPVQLRQVLTNLVENAVFAAAPRGVVGVRGRPGPDGTVELVVDDTGAGVDPVTRRRLFEPLITTKARGIGLGLSLVKRIVERHGGTIAYDDRPGGGARFTLRLPV
jgi:signal transduction histidine kinase